MAEKREVKQCPYCSEEILATAKKCKHCQTFIEEEPVKEAQVSVASEARQAPKAPPPIPPKAPPPPSRGSLQQHQAGKADTNYSPAAKAPVPAPPPRPAAPKAPPAQAAGIAATVSAPPASQSTSTVESAPTPAAVSQTNRSESISGKINVGSTYDYPKAPVGKRIVAYIVDSLIAGFLIIPYAVFLYYDDYYWLGLYDISDLFLFIFFLFEDYPLTFIFAAWFLFYILFRDGFGTGQSWGKKMQGLMVVNLSDNEPCSKGKSAARNSIALVIGFILGLIPVIRAFSGMVDPIIAIAHPKGHRVGDMLAKTQVIEVSEYNAQR